MGNPHNTAKEMVWLAFELGGLPSAEVVATEYTEIGDVAAGECALRREELRQLQSRQTPEDPLMEGTTDLTYVESASRILAAISTCTTEVIKARAAEGTLSQL